MKFQHILLSLAFFATTVSPVFSQKSRARRADSDSEQKWSVGIAPFSLLFPTGKISVRGEWAYAPDKSVSLLVGIPRKTGMPDFSEKWFDLEDEGKTLKNTYSNLNVALEHRFYLGERAPFGLYLAPYARYNQFKLERAAEDGDSGYETRFTGKLNAFGLGGALGAQFRLGEHFSLDATFLGIDFRRLRGTLGYATNDPNQNLEAFRDEVERAVEDIPIIGKKLDVDIDGNEVSVKTPGVIIPGFRFNLTVNYVF